jgi:predicted amidohydrolase
MSSTRIGALQLRPYDHPEAWLRRVGSLVETLVQQGTALIVLPGIPAAFLNAAVYQADRSLQPLQELSRRFGCGLACPLVSNTFDGRLRLTVYLLYRGEMIGSYDQVHVDGERWDPGDALPVFDTPFGKLGIMLGDEGLLPEVSRVLMLQGAELVLWPAAASRFPLRTIARTRADENKVFVALATPLEENSVPQSALVSPAGAFIAQSLPDIEQGIAGQFAWALARYKDMAPKTNVVLSRQPGAYTGIATAA